MNIEYELTQYAIKPIINISYTTKIVKNLRIVSKQLFYFFVILVISLISYVFTLRYVSNIDTRFADFGVLMNVSIKSLFPLLY